MGTLHHLIDGEMVADNGRSADVFNPSTGEAIHKVPLADGKTLQKAIDAARAAFPAWRNTRRPSVHRCCTASSNCWSRTRRGFPS